MTKDELLHRLKGIREEQLPLPGSGSTSERHKRLLEVGREDLSLAKLAEAHWDAQAILAEAGRVPITGALYAVWASEVPGEPLRFEADSTGYKISGRKPFCSGLGLVDRALVTVGFPEHRLVELDLRNNTPEIETDCSAWHVRAFEHTNTGAITFAEAWVPSDALIGAPRWYLERPGFWHGACGPAACWAGGVAALFDYALRSSRKDPHTLAHLGALSANVWAMQSYLRSAGEEIDENENDIKAAQQRALQVRHLIEQTGTDILRRFGRAYGPHPLSMDEEVSKRFEEANLFMRQSHGERDLESLGNALIEGQQERKVGRAS